MNSFLKSNNIRTATIKKNVFYSAGIKGISILVSLVLVPLTINFVSSELYGIWLTLSSIIGWLGFFDVGFGLGLRNKLTTALAFEDFNKGKILVSTTYCVLFIIFTAIAIIGYIIAGYVNWCNLLNVSVEYSGVLITASRIVIISFCATIVSKLIQNVFQAYQMTAAASFVDTVSQVLSLILIFVLTKTTAPDLNNLAFVFCFSPLIVYLCFSFIMYKRKFKDVSPSLSSVDFSYTKDIFSLGGQFFLLQIICIILYQTVNFLISHYCGPDQVTVYNVAYKYLNCGLMVFSIIMAPLWSAYNDAYAKKDYSWMGNIYKKLIRINIIVIIAEILMVCISPIIYRLWVGDAVNVPLLVSILIGSYVICQSIANMHSSILNGMGIIRIQIIQAVFQVLLFVLPLIVLNNYLDLNMILIIMLVSSVLPAIILPIQVNLLLSNKAKGVWNK